MSDHYRDYYKKQLESALQYQDFIVDVLWQVGLSFNQYASRAYQHGIGESRNGIEVKFDQQYAKTGNLWVEVAEKSHPQNGHYVESGIYAHQHTWLYVMGNYDRVFLFPKHYLCQLAQLQRYPLIENNTKTSQGFLLPDKAAHLYASLVLEPKAGEHMRVLRRQVEMTTEAAQILHDIVKAEVTNQLTIWDLIQQQQEPQ